jgi:hypothetical protein
MLLHSATVFICCLVFAELLQRVYSPDSPSLRLGQERAYTLPVVAGSIASALFFGLHPLRVESVVWASERKDVLCLFFITSTFWCYFRFVDHRAARPGSRPTACGAYWLVLLLSCLALMSKPAAVSLPLLLLIMDWYPLARVTDRRSLLRAVTEKLPLLLLAVVAAGMTVLAQQEPIALSSSLTLSSKVLVAGKALLWYLWRTLWPADLAPLHPHPGNVTGQSLVEYLAYAVIVLAICTLVVLLRKRQKIWAALWLFYLVTLAPMLGILHVGRQWVAERYSYLPGLAIALLWGGGVVWLIIRLHQGGHRRRALFTAGIAGLQLLACTMVTLHYIPCWRTTETIASRQIEAYPKQLGVVYYARANYRNDHGEYAGALMDIDEALAVLLRKQMQEKYLPVSQKRAEILRNLDRLPEALAAIEWGIQSSGEKASLEALTLRDELAASLVTARQLPRPRNK